MEAVVDLKVAVGVKVMDSSKTIPSKIVDLTQFRKTKQTQVELARGRKPLYLSHADKNISGEKTGFQFKQDGTFAERLVRIKSSLEKINNLMEQLKKLSDKPR